MVTINIDGGYPRRRRRVRPSRPRFRAYRSQRHDSGDTQGSGGGYIPPAKVGHGWNPIRGYFPIAGMPAPVGMSAMSAAMFSAPSWYGPGLVTPLGAIV